MSDLEAWDALATYAIEEAARRREAMRDTLGALIEAHSRWLRRHRLPVDAEEYIYHADAIGALVALQGRSVDSGGADRPRWEPMYRDAEAERAESFGEHEPADTDERDRDWQQSARDRGPE